MNFKLSQFVIGVLAGGLLAACAPTMQPEISDFDKSQPSVTLTALYYGMESVDWNIGLQKATKQCQEFGYNLAKPLGISDSRCEPGAWSACDSKRITRKYICKNSQ